MKFTKLFLATGIVFFLGLTACGGGGSSSTQPPEPDPPAEPNEAPVISYSVGSDTLNEGETFLFDVRASYDPDGQITSFNVSNQFSQNFPELESVQVNEGSHPAGVFEFLVPEVFADTQGIFEITATDDSGESVTETAYLTFRSTVNDPKTDGFGEPYLSVDSMLPLQLLGINDIDFLATESNANSANQEIVVAANTINLLSNKTLGSDSTVEGEIRTTSTIFPKALNFNLDPVTPIQFVAISEQDNGVFWFADFDAESPHNLELAQTIEIDRPCYINPRVSTSQDFVWIGQRQSGLSVVKIDRVVPTDLPAGTPNSHWARGFDYSVKSQVGGNRSFCYVFPTQLSDRLSNPAPQTNLSDLIAVDYDSNELVLYADDAGNDEIYEELEVISLETDGIQGMKIIDVHGVGSPSSFPNFLLILMSDGIDNGEHRVVIVEQDPTTREISQSSIPFSGGAPTQMIAPGNLFGPEGKSIDFGVDLVIISSTSNQAVILEDERADLELDIGPPVFKAPQYLNIGFGAGSATPFEGLFQGSHSKVGLLVSYPDSRELKVWVYRD